MLHKSVLIHLIIELFPISHSIRWKCIWWKCHVPYIYSRLDKGVLRQIFFLFLHKRKCREIIIIMIIMIIKVRVCDTVISDITPSEDSDQSVCLRSLINVFDRRSLAYQGSKVSSYHFENTPVQIYWKISPPKSEHFSDKKSDIFHISSQNIDCGYSLGEAVLTSAHNFFFFFFFFFCKMRK